MDLSIQRSISDKIEKAIKSGESKALAEAFAEGIKIFSESVRQAVDGYTDYTLPCILAALMINEKAIIKLSARPEDIRMAEFLSRDDHFTCSAIGVPYGKEGAGTEKK